PALGALGAQCLARPEIQWLSSLHPEREDWDAITECLARLYVSGVSPDWDMFDADYRRRRVYGLPTYAFQRRHLGPTSLPPEGSGTSVFESVPRSSEPPQSNACADDAQTRSLIDDHASAHVEAPPVSEWGYVPIWRPLSRLAATARGGWLL